ncbi:hypothetical protein HUJ05_001773 [Dendroctonus ponderosae]|nr:hypothetical protein HUJ05_001773 [Dendroctonus ponderosae]
MNAESKAETVSTRKSRTEDLVTVVTLEELEAPTIEHRRTNFRNTITAVRMPRGLASEKEMDVRVLRVQRLMEQDEERSLGENARAKYSSSHCQRNFKAGGNKDKKIGR